MQTTQGSLVVVNPHTAEKKVFWNGSEVKCSDVRVDKGRVTIVVQEDPLLAELIAAGVKIVRA